MKSNEELIRENQKLQDELAKLQESVSIRKKAEEEIRKNELDSSTGKESRIIHELKVHQTELEMQNQMLHQTQNKLQESKNHYFALFDKSPIGFVVINNSGIVKNINLTFLQLTDLSRSEVINKTFFDCIHPDDRHIFNSRFKAFYKNPESKNLKLRLLNKNGKNIYVMITATSLSFEKKENNDLLLAISNITLQTKAERVLENFFDQPMNIHLICDLEGVIENANQGFFTILGYDPQTLIGTKFFDLIHPDDMEKTENEMKKLAEGQTTFEFENRYKHKDGGWRFLSWSALATKEDEKIYAVASDITKVIRYQNELMASKNQFQNLAETTDAILWEFNINQDKWTYVSPQSKRILGYEPQEWLGLQFWTDHLHPEDRKWASKYCFECTARGESHKFEYRFMNKAGKPVWLRDVVSVEMKDRKPVIMRGFMIDITSRKEMEKQINESNERFKFLSSVTFEGIVIHQNGNVLDSNESFLKLTGYNRKEIIGKNLLDYVPGIKDKTKILKNIVKKVANPYTVEAVKKNGEKFIAEIEAKNVIYQGQKVRIAAIRDVSERKKMQQEIADQANTMQAIFDNAPYILALVDDDVKVQRINWQGVQLAGKKESEIINELGGIVFDCINTFDGQKCGQGKDCKICPIRTSVTYTARSGKPVKDREGHMEFMQNGKKTALDLLVTTSLITIEGNRKILLSVNDITKRKQIEVKLQKALDRSKQKEAEVQELLNAAHAILEKDDFQEVARHIFDACARVIGAKAGYVALMSDSGEENELLFLEAGGMKCDVDPELPMPIRGLRAESYKSGKVVYDNDFMKSEWLKFMPKGHMTLPNVLFAPLNIEGKTVGIMGFACKDGDFDEHDARLAGAFGDYAAIALNNSRIFEALEKSEEAYSQLFHNVGEGIGIVDENEAFTFCNEAAEEIFGVPSGELTGKKLSEFTTRENMEYIQKETEKRKHGESSKYELKITSGKGNEKYIMITANPNYNKQGRVESTFGIFFDITERKKAEEKVQQLLEEKELLLREVHHRIKNNMATIESLLRLQSKQIDNETAIAALNDANSRVKSMRILYDKLFRSDNFQAVDMKDYLSPLIDEVISVFPQKEEVEVIKKIASFSISAKLVFPLGIIVNELITNIMKYAFQNTENNQIIIKTKKIDDRAQLIIKDNGGGLPADFDLKNSSGFGLQLVDMLTNQIRGNIKFESEYGTRITMKFKVDQA
ncbi:MAG: PAS domain S-box protein [Candidatus Cloacimonetes bacterium]|nr:PAS domain S-box protein [Candidatus Cloacimonadota bacterium]MCF7868228.1 PAS domain S-box protein [Candidatus Cloacimonadota bacterium]MCF7883661.1 PAS domain S-box protein [Candidatus Cloacimonadota bacterium]